MRYSAEAVETRYWTPGEDYLEIIAGALKRRIDDGDIIAVSEKALSTAKGRMIDESEVKPGFLARFLARFWMRVIWGYFLGPVCHLKDENLRRILNYPVREGSAHKQVALRYASFMQALMWGSEGGIDASNMPYSYVSLPLENPKRTAEEILRHVRDRLGKRVIVMIVDTDKTYSLEGFHFTHRSSSLKGIHSFGGFIAYVVGRALRLSGRSTPLAVTGSRMDVNLALDMAEAAHRCRGSGAGATVWDMAERFKVSITDVTLEMLRSLKHKPIVILKPVRQT